MNKWLPTLLLFAMSAAGAVTLPTPSQQDPRLQTVDFTQDVIQVKVEIGKVMEIVLRPGESVKEYVWGTPSAWYYSDRDHLVRIKPIAKVPDTNLRLYTTRAVYWFDLKSDLKGGVPAYQVTVLYPSEPPLKAPPTVLPDLLPAPSARSNGAAVPSKEDVRAPLNNALNDAKGGAAVDQITEASTKKSEYMFASDNSKINYERMGSTPAKKFVSRAPTVFNERYGAIGSSALDPIFVKDDGLQTFIKFAAGKLRPTVYAVAADGSESRVSQSVQDDVMIVHRVAERFVLRFNNEPLCLVNLDFKPLGQTSSTKTISPDVVREIIKE